MVEARKKQKKENSEARSDAGSENGANGSVVELSSDESPVPAPRPVGKAKGKGYFKSPVFRRHAPAPAPVLEEEEKMSEIQSRHPAAAPPQSDLIIASVLERLRPAGMSSLKDKLKEKTRGLSIIIPTTGSKSVPAPPSQQHAVPAPNLRMLINRAAENPVRSAVDAIGLEVTPRSEHTPIEAVPAANIMYVF